MAEPDYTLLKKLAADYERRVMGGGGDGGMPPDLTVRVDRLERDVAEIRATLGRLEPLIVRIDATVPSLATKAEVERTRGELGTQLAEKPGKTYIWTVFAALIAATTLGPALLAVLR